MFLFLFICVVLYNQIAKNFVMNCFNKTLKKKNTCLFSYNFSSSTNSSFGML